jgi:hypothetical protein
MGGTNAQLPIGQQVSLPGPRPARVMSPNAPNLRPTYFNAISHNIAKLNDQFGLQISGWNTTHPPTVREPVAVEPPPVYLPTPTGTSPGDGSKPDL